MRTWKHDELAHDLKEYLQANKADRLIWCDMQLGPAGSPRPDVYALPRSYSRFLPFAYEVKISRADFQSDINAGKWQKYYAFASAVVFAVPDGMIKATELPNGAGLFVRKEKVWRMAKAPKVNPLDNLPRETWMKLVMDGLGRLNAPRPAFNAAFQRDRVARKALGEEMAKLIRNRESVEWQIQKEIDQHQKRLESIRSANEAERKRASDRDDIAAREFEKLCDLLGLPRGTPAYRIESAVREAVENLNADNRVSHLLSVITSAEHSLAAAKLRIGAAERERAA